MTSADLGLVREIRETEEKAQVTKEAPLGQVFPIKPMAEGGGEEEAGVVEVKEAEEVGAIKKEDVVSIAHSTPAATQLSEA